MNNDAHMPVMIPAWVEGELTPVEKLAAHERALRHKAVSVFVLWDGHVLLQRRALGKYHTPGLWANTCCTHPHWQEDALTCAHRRMQEELGMTDLPLEPRGRVEYRADVGGGLVEHEVVDVFVAECTMRPDVQLNPEEVMQSEWVQLSQLPALLDAHPERYTPWLRIYMAEHSDMIFGG